MQLCSLSGRRCLCAIVSALSGRRQRRLRVAEAGARERPLDGPAPTLEAVRREQSGRDAHSGARAGQVGRLLVRRRRAEAHALSDDREQLRETRKAITS